MKSLFCALAVCAVSILGPTAALARAESKLIYSYGAWEVRLVGFDDGAVSCLAKVSRASDSFSVWASPSSPVKLQFYSTSWAFDTSTANLKVRIDSFPSWRMTNAKLYKHSVLFNLPNNDAGSKFLLEVARGITLRLYNDSGRHVKSYTLSGSNASIRQLINCVRVLRNDAGGANPFN